MSLEGLCPGPVEYELAAGIGLDVAGYCSNEIAGLLGPCPYQEVARIPAACLTQASGFVQGMQEFVTKKGVAFCRQGIPLYSRNTFQRVADFDLQWLNHGLLYEGATVWLTTVQRTSRLKLPDVPGSAGLQ